MNICFKLFYVSDYQNISQRLEMKRRESRMIGTLVNVSRDL